MLKNTSVHNDKFHIAQGFGRFSYDMNGGGNSIQPTNIYLFGNGLNIENTSPKSTKVASLPVIKTKMPINMLLPGITPST